MYTCTGVSLMCVSYVFLAVPCNYRLRSRQPVTVCIAGHSTLTMTLLADQRMSRACLFFHATAQWPLVSTCIFRLGCVLQRVEFPLIDTVLSRAVCSCLALQCTWDNFSLFVIKDIEKVLCCTMTAMSCVVPSGAAMYSRHFVSACHQKHWKSTRLH